MSLIELTATEAKRELEAGRVSSLELTDAYLARIEQTDGRVGAFISTDAEQCRADAKAIDARRAAGEPIGCLAGLPVAIKDLLCTKGKVTTCASRMLESYRPPYDATVVEKLRAADGVILGKTNMDEFAMGGSTENSALKETQNPWDLSRVPGGSSGGAAACVAAAMTPLSIGTDTGGSIRQPAAYCGVVGLKPTYGRVSRFGLIAFASSLDQIGPLASSSEDVALLLQAIAGHDPRDSTSADVAVPKYSETVNQPLEGITLGIPKQHLEGGLDPEVASLTEAAIEVYRSLGAKTKEVSLEHSKYGIAAYYLVAPSEASSNLARYDGAHYGHRTDATEMSRELAAERKQLEAAGDERALAQQDSALVRMYRKSRAEGFGPEVKRRIMLGTYALSAGYYDAYYLKALKVRRLIRQDYDHVFADVDFVIGPVTPTAAFERGSMIDDPLSLYLQDLFTVSANLAGIASLSIPCGFTSGGLPVGLQLQAPPFEEERLLRAAAMYQGATEWHRRKPELS